MSINSYHIVSRTPECRRGDSSVPTRTGRKWEGATNLAGTPAHVMGFLLDVTAYARARWYTRKHLRMAQSLNSEHTGLSVDHFSSNRPLRRSLNLHLRWRHRRAPRSQVGGAWVVAFVTSASLSAAAGQQAAPLETCLAELCSLRPG